MNDFLSSRKLSRRGLLQSGGLATAALAAACAPATPAPSPTEPSPAGGGWEAEWEALIAAARKEGKVVVQTAIGVGYRNMLEAFGKAFPGIEPEQQAFPDSNSFVTKVTAERQAGLYTFDIASTTVTAMWQVFKPQGFIDPIRPVLFRPDVLDDNAWYGGLDGRFVDSTRTHIFRNTVYVLKPVYINTDLVKPEEVTTLDDLLNPKWKGQIITSDGSQGAVYAPSTLVRDLKGEEYLRRLFVDQQPQVIKDRRQGAEALVRGKGKIGYGIQPTAMADFIKESGVKNISNPEIPGASYATGDVVVLFNKAPHPNAAKLFLNWALSKEGGAIYSNTTGYNSARTDIPPVDPATAPGKIAFQDPTAEEWATKVGDTQQYLAKLLS